MADFVSKKWNKAWSKHSNGLFCVGKIVWKFVFFPVYQGFGAIDMGEQKMGNQKNKKKRVENAGNNKLENVDFSKVESVDIENETDEQAKQEKYNQYVEQITPTRSLPISMAKAFLVGGIICLIGQFITNFATGRGLEADEAGAWTSLLLVLFSVILTGFNIYPSFAQWGGAGALVPITGFANGVAASATEAKVEGQVFGIGCQIFQIAGPVILYGIFTSWVLGIIYLIGKTIGVV